MENESQVDEVSLVDFSKISRYKSNIIAWSLYDLANTIYSMGVVSLTILPLIAIIAISSEAGIAPGNVIDSTSNISKSDFKAGFNYANLVYGIVIFVGSITMAILSPILGAYADQLTKRKYLLSIVTLFCLFFTYLITYRLTLLWVLGFFLLANLSYQIGLVIYDSMLPFIAKPDHVSKAGGFGIAFGYFGSFIAIGFAFALAGDDHNFVLSEDDLEISLGYIPEYFPIVAFAFLILGLPLLFVTEVREEKPKRSLREISKSTKATLKLTGREIYNYDDTKNFMIGWLLFVDIANTVIAFMSVIITVGLGLEADMVFVVLGIGIASAVIFTFPVGWIGDKIGPKKTFYLVGFLWFVALMTAIFTNLTILDYKTPGSLAIIVGVVVGPALGGTWVAQRQMLVVLAPIDRTSNYFGFANIFGRISSAIGPFIWLGSIFILSKLIGLSTSISTRITIGVISIILLLGLHYISKIRNLHPIYLKGGRHVGNGVWQYPNGEIIDIQSLD